MANNTSLTRDYSRIFALMADKLTGENIIWDNVSVGTPLLFSMKELFNAMVAVDGQPHLRFTIMKELPTTLGYTDQDTITPVRPDPFTSAVYVWKQLATPVLVTGLDIIKTGDDGIEDLLEGFLQAAEISHREALGGSALGIFSDGGNSEDGEITGLQTLVSSTPTTGTVGNINRANVSIWQNQSGNVASTFDSTGLNIMRTLYRQCSRYNEVPQVVVLNGSTMDNFERELTSTFQVHLPLSVGPGEQGMIDAGFPNIRYKGAWMFHDDGCPANRGYMLNFKYLKYYYRRGRNAEITDFQKEFGKDNLAAAVLTAGNLCTTGPKFQGALLNGDTY